MKSSMSNQGLMTHFQKSIFKLYVFHKSWTGNVGVIVDKQEHNVGFEIIRHCG